MASVGQHQDLIQQNGLNGRKELRVLVRVQVIPHTAGVTVQAWTATGWSTVVISPLHSLTKGSCPRHGINPETGFEEVAGLVMVSRLVPLGSITRD